MSRFTGAPWPLKAAYLLTLGGMAALALLTLAALVALAGLGQLSWRLDVSAVPAWFWHFRADPQVRRWLAIGLLSSGLTALVAGLGLAKGLRRPLHGAARWATEADLARGGLRARQGVLLGRKGGRLLVCGEAAHVALYAPTRSGKGVSVVIPNLLNWPDSVVVLDVKRENWEATAGFRAAHGQAVFLFDPLAPDGATARYNPLGHIDRTDPIAVMDELQKLAVMLFPTPHRGDPFWAEAARTGFMGVGAYVAQSDQVFSLGVVYAELTRGDPRTRFPKLIKARAADGAPLEATCARALMDFCSTSDATFAGIKQTLTSRMNLFLNPRVCAATEVSDFDLRDLRARRISIYLGVSPDNLARVAPLYNLFFQQLIDLSARERPTPERHPVKVLVVLDEFARLGQAETLARAFSYIAGYGLRLLTVLQSPAQLRAEYGPDLAEDILSNCGIEIAFGFKELRVAQELSERLGYYTYASRSRSRPAGLARGHRSLSEADQRRALMMPQELMQLPADVLLILRAGMPPVRARKITYWRDAAFRARVAPPPALPRRALAAPGGWQEGPAETASEMPPTPAPPPADDLTLTKLYDPAELEPLQSRHPEAVARWTKAAMRAPRRKPDRSDDR